MPKITKDGKLDDIIGSKINAGEGVIHADVWVDLTKGKGEKALIKALGKTDVRKAKT